MSALLLKDETTQVTVTRRWLECQLGVTKWRSSSPQVNHARSLSAENTSGLDSDVAIIRPPNAYRKIHLSDDRTSFSCRYESCALIYASVNASKTKAVSKTCISCQRGANRLASQRPGHSTTSCRKIAKISRILRPKLPTSYTYVMKISQDTIQSTSHAALRFAPHLLSFLLRTNG